MLEIHTLHEMNNQPERPTTPVDQMIDVPAEPLDMFLTPVNQMIVRPTGPPLAPVMPVSVRQPPPMGPGPEHTGISAYFARRAANLPPI